MLTSPSFVHYLLVTTLLCSALGNAAQSRILRGVGRSSPGFVSEVFLVSSICVHAAGAVAIAFRPNDRLSYSLFIISMFTILGASVLVTKTGTGSDHYQYYGNLFPAMRLSTATAIRCCAILAVFIAFAVAGPHSALSGLVLAMCSMVAVAVVLFGHALSTGERGGPRRPKVAAIGNGSALPSALAGTLALAANRRGSLGETDISAPLFPSPELILLVRSDCHVCHEVESSIEGLDDWQSLRKRSLVISDDNETWHGWPKVMVDNAHVTSLAYASGCAGVPCALRVNNLRQLVAEPALGDIPVVEMSSAIIESWRFLGQP